MKSLLSDVPAFFGGKENIQVFCRMRTFAFWIGFLNVVHGSAAL